MKSQIQKLIEVLIANLEVAKKLFRQAAKNSELKKIMRWALGLDLPGPDDIPLETMLWYSNHGLTFHEGDILVDHHHIYPREVILMSKEELMDKLDNQELVDKIMTVRDEW